MACPAQSDLTHDATFLIASSPDAVRDGLRDVMDDPAMMRISQDVRGNIHLVLAEVLNNIVEHAYDHDDGQIALRLTWLPKHLVCDLVDAGLPMPDLELPRGLRPPVGDLEDLPEGGFGWFLIRELTENLTYRRINACNHLNFQLNIEQ